MKSLLMAAVRFNVGAPGSRRAMVHGLGRPPIGRRGARHRLAVAGGIVALLGTLFAATPAAASVALVTLSGHVTDASGPVFGTSVTFNSESAVSDATGLYVLHVPPGTTSSLYFTAGSPAPGAVTQVTAVVENPGLTVGSVDVVEDLVWPTQASVHMSVVDATSTPLVGAVVHGEGGALTGTLSDGTTRVVFNYEMPAGGQTCTPDATGVCTLAARSLRRHAFPADPGRDLPFRAG